MVERTPLTLAVRDEPRRQARLRSTRYSTRIESDRLTLAEAQRVIEGQKTEFHSRERDVREVCNYWNALLRVEEWAARRTTLTEDLIRNL